MAGVALANPRIQFLDSSGNPLSGGFVHVYLAGTTTESNSWQDKAQTTLNTNPIVLDAAGSCLVFLDSELTYKIVVTNSAGVTQSHLGADNVVGAAGLQYLADAIAAIEAQETTSVAAVASAQTTATDAIDLLVTAAETAESNAELAETGAEAAQAAAETARDQANAATLIFADTTAGLAAVASGEYFYVPSTESNKSLILYKDNAGAAQLVKRIPLAPPASVVGFAASFDGLYRGDTGATSTAWTLGASNELIFDSPINRIWYGYPGGYSRDKSGVYEYFVEASCDSTTTGSGAMICVGSGASMRIYGFTKDGSVGVYDKSNATITSLVLANALLGFDADERVSLRLVVGPDDTGFVEARRASGYTRRFTVSSVPEGPVGVALRDDDITTIYRFTGQQIQTDLQSMIQRDTREGAYGPVLRNMTVLPALTGGASSGGFTATGLDRITRGQWAGCWIVASEGRTRESDGSSFNPQIAIISPDFGKIVQLISLSGNTSIQGVAVDTSGSEDTFWVAFVTNTGIYDGDIRHYELYDASYTNYGTTANTAVEISADRIDFDTTYSHGPNGLAYDSANDALWVGGQGFVNTVRQLSCADGSLLDSITVTEYPDQLHYDATNQLLYYSNGNNGSNGVVYAYRIEDDENAVVYSSLSRAQAIEGIYIDRDLGELFVINDGGYHFTAAPALNVALRYAVNLLY